MYHVDDGLLLLLRISVPRSFCSGPILNPVMMAVMLRWSVTNTGEQVFNILFSGDDVQHPRVVCFVIVN